MIEPLIVLVTLLALIAIGAPIFLALGAAGMIGLYMARGSMALFFGPSSLFAQLNSFELLALPLFVLMGNFLSATPVGANLYRAAALWFNRLRGGLAIATVGASTVFGAVSGVSVADLFIGGIVPGGILAMALAGYIWIRASLNPSEAPRETEATHWGARLRSLGGLWHAALLVLLVLGVIYSGVATPSEAGAFGALGALALAALVFRSLTWMRFWQIIASSARISGAILLIMGSARIFGDYLNLIRLPDTVSQALTQTQLPTFAILMVVMIALLFLGMLIDAVSLIVVTTPILLPLITALGYDPLWFGIILVMNLEMAVITPPVGLNLYTLKAVAPVLAIEDIIRSVLPFVILQFLVLAMFVLVPEMALWLPGLMP